MQKLKVGVVSATRGASFAGIFKCFPDVEVVAMCEINEERLKAAADRLDIPKRFTNYGRFLEEDLDVVAIGTPMHLHVPQAVKALDAGCHVISEVPAAVTLQQCVELVQAVRRSGRKYMMAENYCYMRHTVLVREMARRGVFGETYFAEGEYIHELKNLHHGPTPSGVHDPTLPPTWRYIWQVGRNGCTYPTHSLGPALEFLGAEERVKTVSCIGTGRWTDPEHVMEDTVLMLCKTTSDKLIKVRLDMLSDRPHNLTFYSLQGTDGCYEAPRGFGDDHKVWIKGRHKRYEWHSLWEFEEEFMPDFWKHPPEEALRAGHGGGDYWEVWDFLNAIRNDISPPIDVYRALDYTVPGLLSEESIERGGIPLPVPDFRGMPDKDPYDWLTRVTSSSQLGKLPQ
jgi:predicted dehydrogenase